MTRPNVEFLLVEDSEDDILLIQECFAEAEIANRLNIVRDGEEAMTYLRKLGPYANVREPSVVVLDMNMPKMNGLEVLRTVKADPALRHIPVVILTTSERNEDIDRAYAEGAAAFMTKPSSFEDYMRLARAFSEYWLKVVELPARDARKERGA